MTDTPTTTTCAFPGCEDPAERPAGPGRPPRYCEDPAHNAQAAFRAKHARPAVPADGPADLGRPVTMATTRAGLAADRITTLVGQLVDQLRAHAEAVRAAGDPDALDAQLDAVTTEANQRVSDAEANRAVERALRLAAEDRAETLAAAAEDMAAQVDDVRAQLATATVEAARLRGLIEERDAQLAEARRAVAAAAARADELAGQLDQALDERAAYRDQIDQLTGEVAKREREQATAAVALADAEQRLASETARLAREAERDREQATAVLAAERQRLADRDDANRELREELARVRAETTEARGQVSALTNQVSTLAARVAGAEPSTDQPARRGRARTTAGS